jgi:hypothetical protein
MIELELDFAGFASLAGGLVGECLDAAGIDGSVEPHGRDDEHPAPRLP